MKVITRFDSDETIDGIRSALPRNQIVESAGESCNVDNAWLHDALDGLKSDDFDRFEQIIESLQAVEARVAERQEATRTGDSKGWAKSRLESILARPEYATGARGPNALTRLLRDFLRWLQKFLPKPVDGGYRVP